MKKSLVNCISCGRDTTQRSRMCWRCEHSSQVDDQRGRHILQMIDYEAEDDYSEESGPNDVYYEQEELWLGLDKEIS